MLSDFIGFMRARKKWWMAPVLIALVLIAVLAILAGTGVLAPLIYSLF